MRWWDEFEVIVTAMSISRALRSIGWPKKVARSVAKERNVDLRDSISKTCRLSILISLRM